MSFSTISEKLKNLRLFYVEYKDETRMNFFYYHFDFLMGKLPGNIQKFQYIYFESSLLAISNILVVSNYVSLMFSGSWFVCGKVGVLTMILKSGIEDIWIYY